MRVRFEDFRGALPLDLVPLKELSRRVLTENRTAPMEVTVVLVDDASIADLNQRFLGRDRPTDVLAFDLGQTPPCSTAQGEVYVSVDRAHQQAKVYQVPLAEEVARLVIHGLLHLSGFDDTTPADRLLMDERTEAYLELLPTAARALK